MKRVTTIIRNSPFNSVIASEALRMSLGLTLTDNRVTVIFVEDGVYLLTAPAAEAIGYADVNRHMQTLTLVDCQLIAEKESLKKRGLGDRKVDANICDREEIDQIIEGSDRVITF